MLCVCVYVMYRDARIQTLSRHLAETRPTINPRAARVPRGTRIVKYLGREKGELFGKIIAPAKHDSLFFFLCQP